jgi:PKD repeat protein
MDGSSSGATARYLVYPGDADPTLEANLFSPTDGTQFTNSKILVSGRADDDNSLRSVQVAIVDSNNKYMNGSGNFGNSENWRTAFLNSPGSPGSNYSFTTPTIPAGNYTVRVRAVDGNDQIGPISESHVSVTAPPNNNPPVANFTSSCNQNVCTFDGTTSTDENAPTLSYAWNFGQGSGSGPKPTKTYTSANTFTVTLTVTDEYGATGTTSKTVTITEPAGNVAPNPVINQPSCNGLVCNFSAVGSADPNTGDSITYLWNFGDNATSTSAATSHTYASGGTYTVTLTTTDGWGKSKSVTRQLTVP